MPRMALCGRFRIGVDMSDPNTPPLVMVKVPPCRSSTASLPSRAFSARAATAFSMSAKLMRSACRSTGTINPFSVLTATLMLQ